MIDFGNHYCVAQIRVLSLGICCPSRNPSLLVSCSPVPHHVIPEGRLKSMAGTLNLSCRQKTWKRLVG